MPQGNRIAYNLDTSGTWSLAEVQEGYFTSAWIFSTNDIRHPIVTIMGQAEWATLEDAQLQDTISSLNLTGFPQTEFKPLYRLIYQTSSAYTNDIKAKIVDIEDIRDVKVSAIAVTGSQLHSGLGGLDQDDHTQYVHIATPRTINARHTFNPPEPNSPFILGANAQGQKVNGLNADLLDGLDSSAFQLLDSDLTALANTNTTGLYTITGTGTSVTRSVTGTISQIKCLS